MDALSNEVYQALMMDLLLAVGLLALFVYVARLSRNVLGVAMWGVMHFLYTLGTTTLDAIAPLAAEHGYAAEAAVLVQAGVFLACVAMMGMALAVSRFVRQQPLLRWEWALLALAAVASLAVWLGWHSHGLQTVVLTLVEIAAFVLMGWRLLTMTRAPNRVPARLMVGCCVLLVFLYGSVVPGWSQGVFGFSAIWVSVDVSAWFMLNFCMLMLASFRAAEGLRHSAMTDPLTGALNRRGFEDALLAHSNAPVQACAAISFDIDHFKTINDRFGHAAGDETLRRLADVVRGQLRAGDLFERAGGDEFTVLLQGATQQVALDVAERMRSAVKDVAMHAAAQPGEITISVGVHAEPGLSVENLVRRADAALYQAKRAGRNRVACVGWANA